MAVTKEQIQNLLSTLIDPHTELDLVSSKQVKAIEIEGNSLRLKLVLGYPAARYHTELKTTLTEHLMTGVALDSIQLEIETAIVSHAVQKNLKPLAGVRNIIAVASG